METESPAPAGATHDAAMMAFIRVRQFIYSRFAVQSLHVSGGSIRFEAGSLRAPWADIRREAHGLGFNAYKQQWGGRTVVTLVQRRTQRTADEKRELRTAWLLFLATACTTLLAGWLMASGTSATWWGTALNTASFSAGLLFILGTHEMAHKLAALRNGVQASPPKFIPVPTIIGTLGAFIRLRSPLPDENAAVDMGISGPVAGFIAAMPVLIIGILLSDVRPAAAAAASEGGIYFAEPLIFKFLAYTVLGIDPDNMIYIHPLAFAGWVGLLVTMLNLLPIGQLDGGHIARAMLGPRGHTMLSYARIAGLIAMGLYTGYLGWYLWAAIAAFFLRFPYPPHSGAIAPLRTRNILLALLGLAILTLCFMPMPVSVG